MAILWRVCPISQTLFPTIVYGSRHRRRSRIINGIIQTKSTSNRHSDFCINSPLRPTARQKRLPRRPPPLDVYWSSKSPINQPPHKNLTINALIHNQAKLNGISERQKDFILAVTKNHELRKLKAKYFTFAFLMMNDILGIHSAIHVDSFSRHTIHMKI